jgi:glycosyltransferase involved in cell wall biosynthesis
MLPAGAGVSQAACAGENMPTVTDMLAPHSGAQISRAEKGAPVHRVLVVIPAYNEEKTIANVLCGLRQTAPEFDRLVVDDGSRDSTAKVVADLSERQLRLICNLGYGYALQAGIRYALAADYSIVVTLDADGQHQPQDVRRLVDTLLETQADMVIGSRFCANNAYSGPLDRRLGQWLFSLLTYVAIGQRIYDTTSGFKAIRAEVCSTIINATFMDFHAETIVRLSMLGYRIREVPIVVRARAFGRSMHSMASVFQYPLKTAILTVVAALDVMLARRAK